MCVGEGDIEGKGGGRADDGPGVCKFQDHLSQLSEELASRGVDVQCGANTKCLRHGWCQLCEFGVEEK